MNQHKKEMQYIRRYKETYDVLFVNYRVVGIVFDEVGEKYCKRLYKPKEL